MTHETINLMLQILALIGMLILANKMIDVFKALDLVRMICL